MLVFDLGIIQEACKTILAAVDNNELSAVTETLELVTKDEYLYINVTNREYFAQVKVELPEKQDFHATVNAMLFLKLISQLTTNSVEFDIKDNSLVVKANGVYNLPLIFDGEKLLELPAINIENVTNEFNIDSSILKSILTYNSKELLKGSISRPVQKLFYVDDQGAITFTNGACVNSFTLEQPVKLLFNSRLVKLFKLFDNGDVSFKIGFDAISDDIIQTKVRFETDTIVLTAILSCDDTLLTSVPVAAIRGRANGDYPYLINLNKDMLLQTINRLLLFNSVGGKSTLKPYSTFEFGKDSVVIYDVHKDNKETISYNNTLLNCDETYVAILDLVELKITLENCVEQYINLHFGDHSAFVLSRGNIKNVIPECSLN